MTRHSHGLLIAGFGLIVMSFWPATASGQTSRDLYKDALKSVEVQDWQNAILLLRRAIAVDPEAKAGTFKRYVPHYYLGLSLFELGNCKSALAVWADSHKQGVITRLKEYDTLKQGVSVCRKRIARQETTSDLAEITGFATALAELRDQPELASSWAKGDPSWNERLEAAQRLMAAAGSVLEKSDNQVTLDDLEKAKSEVLSAAQQLEVIQTEARNQFTEVQAKLDVRSRLIEMLLKDARQVLDATAYLEPYPPRLGEVRGQVQGLVAEAGSTSQKVDPDALDDLRFRLSKALEKLKQASVPPPETLLNAAKAFLSAQHERVLELLAGEDLPTGRQAAHAHLFRAASLYSLWVAGGEEDDLLLADASGAVRSCREEDIALVPQERAFSPRFVEFFFSEGQVRAPIPLDLD